MEIDKSKMWDDTTVRARTVSLFLELNYDEAAVYSLKENHWTHATRGFYPSIKRLYVEMEDPTEYEFANTYFLGWKHWQQICASKVMMRYIKEWREELEVKLRCKGVKSLLDNANTGNYQAAKWLVDRGWATRPAGRPSKSEIEGEKALQARIHEEYADDIQRLRVVK